MKELWRQAILPNNATLGQAVRNLDEVAIKIVLVVNESGILVGTISDGDIRRGLIRGLNLDSPISTIFNRSPLVLPPTISHEMVKQLMVANKIQQIPIVNEVNLVIGLHLWDEITEVPKRTNAMVIMAGGKGIRLRPITENCPKPLLLIDDKPILEHIINRAKLDGFTNFVLAVHYLGHMIEDYFGNGDRLGVQIDYLRENMPLGTAGALSLLDPWPNEPFVVTNGDVLTDVRYSQLLDFHVSHSADATMAVRTYEWQHPFGVVKTQGVEIIGFEEKPISRTHINAGIYVLNPDVLGFLSLGGHCDMPTLFNCLQENNKNTAAYLMHEQWLDVGRPDDLAEARLKGS